MNALAPITKYVGNEKEPKWMDIERGTYNLCFCMVTVPDTHNLKEARDLMPRRSRYFCSTVQGHVWEVWESVLLSGV